MEKILRQWHEIDLGRYQEEQSRIQDSFPGRFQHYLDKDGNACWEGKVEVRDEKSGELYPKCEYNPLQIKIVCGKDYPKTIPDVFDVNGILRQHGCIHLHEGTDKICYGMRGLDKNCNFHKDTRIDNLITQIGVFIFNQWVAENNEGVWARDRLHGIAGFLEYEIENSIPLNEPCPCGKNSLYINCCLANVEKEISDISQKLDIKPSKKLKRNELCPCSSGKKYKKCCFPRKKFIAKLMVYLSKDQLLQIFKEISSR